MPAAELEGGEEQMIIGWPQGIYLGLAALALLISVMKNGEPLKGKYDPWIVVLRLAISLPLLWWGGFFGLHS